MLYCFEWLGNNILIINANDNKTLRYRKMTMKSIWGNESHSIEVCTLKNYFSNHCVTFWRKFTDRPGIKGIFDETKPIGMSKAASIPLTYLCISHYEFNGNSYREWKFSARVASPCNKMKATTRQSAASPDNKLVGKNRRVENFVCGLESRGH